MGNQVTTSNREVALQATLPVRKVCDQILEYMLKEINIKDFYLLATKRECSRYVIFLANQMDRTFRSLRFAPARGQAGVIYFQPIDILQKPTAEQQSERQSLCLFLDYFYVRIFQIYGSLAITLIDDANVFVKFKTQEGLTEQQRQAPYRGVTKPYGAVGAPNPLPSRFDPFVREPASRGPAVYPYKPGANPLFRIPGDRDIIRGRDGRERKDIYDSDRYRKDRDLYDSDRYRTIYGGADEILPESQLGKFIFLRNKLDKREVERAQIVDGLDFKKNIGHPFLSSGIDATFKLKMDDFKRGTSNVNEGSIFIKISSDRHKTRFYEIRMEIVNRVGGQMLRIISVRYEALLEEAISSQRLKYGGPRPSLRDDLTGEKLRKELYDIYGVENGEFEIDQDGSEFKFDTKLGQQTILQFIKSLKENFDILLGFRRPSDYRDLTRRDSRATGEVNSSLDIVTMLDYIQQKKPIAHCIARGLQLLGNRNLDGTFTSSACQTKFLLSKRDFEEKTTDRTGLPAPGGKISEIAGLQALSNLFYDTIKFKSNNLIRSSKSVTDYIDFMQKMTAVFVGDEEKVKILGELKGKTAAEKEATVRSSEFPKLDEMTDSQMASMCNNLQDYIKDPIHPKSPEGRAVLKQAALLFGRQIRHAANCGRILRQLFSTVSINGVVSIRINKMVFIKGILELNRINDQARRVLIDYYTDCESLYKTGVDILNKTKQGQDIQREAITKKDAEKYNTTRKASSASSTRGGDATRKQNRIIYV